MPIVGDKNVFAGICTLLEYFPSSYIFNMQVHVGHILIKVSIPSIRQYLSCDDCLGVRR